MTPTLIKSYPVAATIAGHLFVKPASGGTAVAAAATDLLFGVAEKQGADAGGMLDVVHEGTYLVRAGGTVAAGDPLTSDAAGKAVKAQITASTAVFVGAVALEAGVDGDLIRVLLMRAWLSKPSA